MAQIPDAGVAIEPLILCPTCKVEMRLFGIEPQKPGRDVFTFICGSCGRLEVRGVSTT